MTLLIDTTVAVDVLRGRHEVIERLRLEPELALISAISVEELEVGAKRLRDQKGMNALLAWLAVVPVGEAEGRLSGAWRRDYAVKGTTLSQPDALIAASAHLRSATLATANVKHFPMRELRIEHWASQPGG